MFLNLLILLLFCGGVKQSPIFKYNIILCANILLRSIKHQEPKLELLNIALKRSL